MFNEFWTIFSRIDQIQLNLGELAKKENYINVNRLN